MSWTLLLGLGLGLLRASADVAHAGFGMVIASDSDCPSAAAVRDELGVLKYPSPDAASVAVHADAEGVSVSFGAPAGVGRGPRILALAPECARRAATVALLIAAWLGRLPAGPPPSLAMVAEPALPDPWTATAAPVAAGPPRREVDVGAGLAAYVQAGRLVPALRLDVGGGSAGTGSGWELGLMVPAPQATSVGLAQAHWMRPSLTLTERLRKVGSDLRLDVNLGAVAGLALAWGEGFVADQQDAGVAAGGSAALRVSVVSDTLGPWIELRGRVWLVSQQMAWGAELPDRPARSLDLPVFELELALGASLPL
jgi:hypothetical protein